MNVDKAKKRIAKRVKRGDRGYPKISIEYLGPTQDLATEVLVTYLSEEGAQAQEQRFVSTTDAREDETIQSVLLKIIERAEPNTVIENSAISIG